MLPSFPAFAPLSLAHRGEILAATAPFLPYSDFQFTSLWAWDVHGGVRVSDLYGNLVVRFTDYLSGQPFVSFLGDMRSRDTVRVLLDYATDSGMESALRVVPEESVCSLAESRFGVTEEPDQFDYLLSLDLLQHYGGTKLRPKRRFVRVFRESYEATTREIDLADPAMASEIQLVFERWARMKGGDGRDAGHERRALARLLRSIESIDSIVAVATFIEGRMRGFSINEVARPDVALNHFIKADSESYVGIYPYLMQETAHVLAKRGCKWLNFEQDLGIPGLRQGKRSYVPDRYLRKFRVSGAQSRAITTPSRSECADRASNDRPFPS